ncbi:MAG: hypothetical protein LBB65_07225 [Burkholderiales bacterium]|jgi:hypothetical protein|nr:hypothetical protein [Burkholderiales bacterium]
MLRFVRFGLKFLPFLFAMLALVMTLPAQAQTPYVDASGNAQTSPVAATPLTGGGATVLNSGWYISDCSVSNPAAYAGTITVTGNGSGGAIDGKIVERLIASNFNG